MNMPVKMKGKISMKKKLAFTLALMMTAMSFSGCGGSDSSSDGG